MAENDGMARGQDERGGNFVADLVDADIKAGKNGGRVMTRFPPEPNGYLHIGHAKSICLNFGLARDFGGVCNLRFDDTNPRPRTSSTSSRSRTTCAGSASTGRTANTYASDYFERLYQFAVQLIEQGQAYVDSRSHEEIRATRGDYFKPGRGEPAPATGRSPRTWISSARMRAGEFPDGAPSCARRSTWPRPNLKLRDPVMYRILQARHHRTGDAWCIYPMYDWAHG